MAIIPSFFGRLFSEGAGVAVGTAAAKGVEPPLQNLANTMESAFANKPLDPVLAAALQARETTTEIPGIDLGEVAPKTEAAYAGVRGKRFDALTELAREHPSVGELLALRRRRLALGGDAGIGREEYREWMRRNGFTAEIVDALSKLLVQYLDPAIIANAVQQGFVPNPDILPDPTPPQRDWTTSDGPFTIPVEQIDIDPIAEAGVAGYDKARLKIETELSGNPPGEETLLDMWRRRIIGSAGYVTGLREGRTKTKWTAALSARFWQLLPPSVLVNLRLRGYIQDADFHNRMALHGYRAEAANDWFLASGRPLAPQQMLDLIARKGPSPTGGVFDFDDFDKGMVESDIKPKYATPAHALYYKYPPLFQLRRAVESGGLTKDRAREIMHIERYEPQDIDALLASWKVTTDTTTDPNVDKAKVQLWGTIHRSFLAAESTATQARATLTRLGVPPTARDEIISLWTAERELIRKQLTAAQVKKAWAKAVRNPATGAAWTREDAIAALIERGYSLNDANTFLDE